MSPTANPTTNPTTSSAGASEAAREQRLAAYNERRSLRDRAKADAVAQSVKTREIVEFPGRDLRFEVRVMRAGELTRLMAEGVRDVSRAKDGGKLETRAEVDAMVFLPRVLAFSTFDPDAGDDAPPLWPATDEGFAEINALATDVYDRIGAVALRLNGLTPAARAELGNGSSETEDAGRSSVSPNDSEA